MYDEYDKYLDELLEEAYLEGYYDSIDDYDDYYMERKSTIHPVYMSDVLNMNHEAWRNTQYLHKYKINEKLRDKYKDEDTLKKYLSASDKLFDNKWNAYYDRLDKDEKYLYSKGVVEPYITSDIQMPRRRPLDMDKYITKAEKGKANLEKHRKNKRN